jgi:hypothetical protein
MSIDRVDYPRRHEQWDGLLRHEITLTPAVFQSFLCSFGRLEGARLLLELWDAGLRDPALIASAAPAVWQMLDHREWPALGGLTRSQWLTYFEHTGFVLDGVQAVRPEGRVRLYRGCQVEHRRGMSWTENLDLARRFAARAPEPEASAVWTADVPWHRVMAVITNVRDGEHEHVVDPKGLRIRRFETRDHGAGRAPQLPAGKTAKKTNS